MLLHGGHTAISHHAAKPQFILPTYKKYMVSGLLKFYEHGNNEPQNYSDLISVGGQTFHLKLVEQVTRYKNFIYIFYYQ